MRQSFICRTSCHALILALSGAMVVAIASPANAAPTCYPAATNIVEEVLAIAPVFDGHNDVPAQLRRRTGNMVHDFDFTDTTRRGEDTVMHSDLMRLRQGRVGTQFWSVWVTTEQSESEAVVSVLEQIDVLKRLVAHYPDHLALVTDSAGVIAEHAAPNQATKCRIAGLIGIEGGHAIGSSLAVLRQLYALGARYMTLTHSKNTPWADSATDTPIHGGLTDFGRAILREMNRLGMIIDLSHVSEDTMTDALSISKTPVIFSHSGVRALNGHPRNVPDAVLPLVKANGGVIMVVFLPRYISEKLRLWHGQHAAEEARGKRLFLGDPKAAQAYINQWVATNPRPQASIADVADHIDHIRAQIGIDYIGLGGDYDGMSNVVAGLEDTSTYPSLFVELARRGYSAEDMAKIARGNVIRVMQAVEAHAARQVRTSPIETPIPKEHR